MKPRVMFDTGALIALERRDRAMQVVFRLATETAHPPVVTTPVVAEWWRSGRREKERASLLRALLVEAPNVHVAKLAGVAVGRMFATIVDVLVVVSASIRGDIVYTSDVPDLERLAEVFPNVEIVRV